MYISRAPLELNLIEKVTRLPTWNAANKNGAYLNCQIRTSFMYARYIPYFKKGCSLFPADYRVGGLSYYCGLSHFGGLSEDV